MNEVTASGRFDIIMTPGEAILAGTGRFDFTKTWQGEVSGTSVGVMLSAGDPSIGTAGYVAQERFEGTIGSRRGTVVFQQFGAMVSGLPELRYEVAPGSGTAELANLIGVIELDAAGGDHTVTIRLRSA
jgi:hypothetical protein